MGQRQSRSASTAEAAVSPDKPLTTKRFLRGRAKQNILFSSDDLIQGLTVDGRIVADEAAYLGENMIAALRPMRARFGGALQNSNHKSTARSRSLTANES
jgi:hypothetical protein